MARNTLVFTATMVLLLLVVLATCRWLLGVLDPRPSLVAWAVCWVAGLFGLVLAPVSKRYDTSGLSSVLVGMMVRMGLPLVLLVIVFVQWGKPAALNLAVYVLVFYPFMLVVATLQSVAGGAGQLVKRAVTRGIGYEAEGCRPSAMRGDRKTSESGNNG